MEACNIAVRIKRAATSGRWLAIALLVIFGALTGCNTGGVGQPAPHPTASATRAAPVSAAWQATYAASDGRLHIVSLDGKRDVVGPMLPDMNVPGLNFQSAGASPDGHMLAYSSTHLVLIRLGTNASLKQVRQVYTGGPEHGLIWSPDSAHLAIGDGRFGIDILDARSDAASPQPIPAIEGKGVGAIIGWSDTTHLVVTATANGQAWDGAPGPFTTPLSNRAYPGRPLCVPCSTPSPTPPVQLATLDTVTGQLRTITTLTGAQLGTVQESLSPDGSTILVFNRPFRDDPYAPLVALVDVASGHIQRLPSITTATGSQFISVAWEPQGRQVAVTAETAQADSSRAWLLDVDHDYATSLPIHLYINGWAPGTTQLVVSDAHQSIMGYGPTTLALISTKSDQPTTTLTTSAMSFPFAGFVRTA